MLIIKIDQVMQMLGVKKTAIYRMVSDGTLPAPIKVGGASRWILSEVENSIDAMIQRRNNPQTRETRRGRPPRFICRQNSASNYGSNVR